MKFFCKRSLRPFLILLPFLTATTWPDKAMAAPQITISWTYTSTQEDGFKIERETGTNGTFAQIATVAANATSYTDTQVTSGMNYCYRARAYNAMGNSAYSNAVCGDTVPNQIFTLTVNKTGAGTVSSAPPGIACGATCSASYPSGTAMTLTAAPAYGSTFAGWSGGGCSGTGTCTVALTTNTAVTATFATTAPQTYTLTVNKTGSGTVSSAPTGIACGATCSASYPSGTAMTLTAAPAAGSTFAGWSGGGCSGTGTCTVTLTTNTAVTATFATTTLQTYTLTVNKTGSGNGTVNSTPAGISCGTDCTGSYASGTQLTLAANPSAGSTFSGWSGACSGTGPCTVALSTNQSVSATFSESPSVKIGIFRPSTGEWYLDLNGNGKLDSCTVDACIGPFGQEDDRPVVGDWNGTGTIQIGVFDPRERIWKLDRNGNDKWDGCGIDLCFGPFWKSQDLPVVGRWTSDAHTDRIGIYRPSMGKWRFDLNGNGLWEVCNTVDRCRDQFLGTAGKLPIVGDWTDTATTKIGLFDPRTGMWQLDLNGNGRWDTCTVDSCLGPFGNSGDLPVAGDWTGTGKARIGVFDPSTGTWELDLNGNGKLDGCTMDVCLGPFGQPGDLPVVGMW